MNYEYWFDIRDFWISIADRWEYLCFSYLHYLVKDKGIHIQIGNVDINKEIEEIEIKLKISNVGVVK